MLFVRVNTLWDHHNRAEVQENTRILEGKMWMTCIFTLEVHLRW